MLPLIAHLQPGVAHLPKRKRAADKKLEARLLAERELRLLLVESRELRLGVEGVHVTWPAFHEEHDHVFCPRRQHGRLGSQRPREPRLVVGKQLRSRHSTKRGAQSTEKRAAMQIHQGAPSGLGARTWSWSCVNSRG